jgi:hypothetical protein
MRHEMKTGRFTLAACVAVVSCLMPLVSGLASDPPETTVGFPGKIEGLMLPGTELEAVPIEDRKVPVVIQALTAYPHGTAFRYDITYYALEPGTLDLKPYLRRKDGSKTTDLPSIPIKVKPLLPPGQIVPTEVQIQSGPRIGGYWTMVWLAVAAWVVGLLAIIYFGFIRRGKSAVVAATEKPVTLADRLKPLVEGAVAGKLSPTELAGLERTLHAVWRRRLKLENADPADAIIAMRQDKDAGPLLEQLEKWLHRPATNEPVDVAALLKPYREMPADAMS